MGPQDGNGSFTVRHAGRDSAGKYNYDIYRGPTRVARYCMIIAGDAHGIVFGDGAEEDEPVGTMPEFLTGGGPRPLRLSVAAIAHVKKRLDSRA